MVTDSLLSFGEDPGIFTGPGRYVMIHLKRSLSACKKGCDEYFVNQHRDNEMRDRGVFYDYLRPADPTDADRYLPSRKRTGMLSCRPISHRHERMDMPYGEREISWQEIRAAVCRVQLIMTGNLFD